MDLPNEDERQDIFGVQIDGLRNWAEGRARRASSPKAQAKLSRKLA